MCIAGTTIPKLWKRATAQHGSLGAVDAFGCRKTFPTHERAVADGSPMTLRDIINQLERIDAALPEAKP